MTDYGVTENGFVIKPFDQIRAEVEAYQRGNISNGLVLADDTSLGAHNISHINQDAELWELAQTLYASLNPNTANDWSLSQICSLTGTAHNKWSKTLVTGIVTLNPNKALPAGSVAYLEDRPNSLFVTLTEVPANSDGGEFEVIFEAKEAGAISVAEGQLSGISVAVSGWTAVRNEVAGVAGSEPEEDPELRIKRERELESQGSASLDAIIAEVSDTTKTPGVVDVDGIENDTGFLSDGLPGHSVHIYVRGGDASEIATSIYNAKASGIRAFGSTLIDVLDSQGRPHTIGHTQAISVPVYVKASIVPDDDWNESTEDEVKEAIAAYINNLKMACDVVYDKVTGYTSLSDGVYRIHYLLMSTTYPGASTSDIAIDLGEFAECDVANIEISWVA